MVPSQFDYHGKTHLDFRCGSCSGSKHGFDRDLLACIISEVDDLERNVLVHLCTLNYVHHHYLWPNSAPRKMHLTLSSKQSTPNRGAMIDMEEYGLVWMCMDFDSFIKVCICLRTLSGVCMQCQFVCSFYFILLDFMYLTIPFKALNIMRRGLCSEQTHKDSYIQTIYTIGLRPLTKYATCKASLRL